MTEPQQRWVAILGRRDTPADGVEDYCTFLGRALSKRGVTFRQVRVSWFEKGRIRALRQLSRECLGWRGQWVVLQYTALSWSQRGFPFFALAVLKRLRRGGARTAVMFHEPYRQGERWPRLIDRIRGRCQDWVIRALYNEADKCIFADPLETIAWLPRDDKKSAFISIGANIPEPELPSGVPERQGGVPQMVAVFCLTHPPRRQQEIGDISHAIGCAAVKRAALRVVFLGRGTPEACEEIERAFHGTLVEVSVLGLLRAEEISQTLAQCDAMLCVRGQINPRRSSVIAGIACGVPIIGYAGSAEGTALATAGIEFVPHGDRDALAAALTRVLEDATLRRTLREKNRNAQREYFSWDAIAKGFVDFLGAEPNRG
jgi:glycosyltransferase involved in cell wall biosynthesis